MLPNDWKDWETCTDENLYVRFGLNPQIADSYTSSQIEAAFEERKAWWKDKSSTNPLWSKKNGQQNPALLKLKTS
jgi:hypothetical protein